MAGELTGNGRTAGGLQLVEVRWDNGSRSMVPEVQLETVAAAFESLDDHVSNPRFGHVDDLRRLLTFQKLQGSLHEFIYSMQAARIQFLEYQFKPVLKFIDSPTERLLIADEVGLGKTIEAALIWLELQARRNAKRLLVVCPGMLTTKWQRELRDKFGVAAEIREPSGALEELKAIERAGRHAPAVWIVSYTGFRPWRDDWLRLNDPEHNEDLSIRGRFLEQLGLASAEEPFFDLVIFDEAHLMRNSETATSRLGRLLMECSRSLLCVSATPVNNRSEDLFSLLRLIDDDFFNSPVLFEQLLEENRGAIAAMNTLLRHPVDRDKLVSALGQLKKSQLVGSLPALKHAIDEAQDLQPEDYDKIIRLQSLVDDLNVLGSYISRTRRRQVKERRPVRRVKVLPVEFTDQEERFYWGVTTGVRLRVAEQGGQFSIFHLITPQLRMASCIPAMIKSYRDGGIEDLDTLVEAGFDVDSSAEADSPAWVSAVDQLRSDLRDHDFEAHDSKYNALRSYILEQLGASKAVLFSFFRGTLEYLAKRLGADQIRCAVIHGGIPQSERDEIIDRFREEPDLQILLSSEVGSEGIDLQFCSVVVNYDLPWNPMRIEQRIGRIDRVGQKSESLTVVHFKVKDTIEERLYDRLHQKLQIFENSIGDLEAVLGEETEKLGRELLSRELTEAEERSMIAQTETAVRSRLEQMRQLEESGGALLAHGDFISERVGRQRDMGRFISPYDLQIYLQDFFFRNFQGCREAWDTPLRGCFEIELTGDASRSLDDFMRAEKYPAHPGIRGRLVWGSFDPETANTRYRRQLIPLHNHLSPLVRWITKFNETTAAVSHPLAAFVWRTSDLSVGSYAYRIERWILSGLRKQEHLSFALVALGSGEVFSATDSERLIGCALASPDRWDFPSLDSSEWQEAQKLLKSTLSSRFDEACTDFGARNHTLLQIQVAQVERHFARRKEIDMQRLQTMQAKGRRESMMQLVLRNIEKDEERARIRVENMNSRAAFSPEIAEVGAGLIRVESAS